MSKIKKKGIISIIIFILIIVIGFLSGKYISEKKVALDIINNFGVSNYQYTKISSTNYNDEDIIYKGEIISSPYQGIEEYVSGGSIIKLNYTYEEDGKIYSDTKLELEPEKYTWMKKQETNKLNFAYVQNNLSFKRSGIEKESNNKLIIYKTSYPFPVFYEDENGKASLSSTIEVKYFLDMKNKTVVKIIVDESEYAQDYQVIQKMVTENITEKEARSLLTESNNSEKSITTIIVSNVGEPLTITAPKEE